MPKRIAPISYIEDLTAADMASLKSGDKVMVTITEADKYDLYVNLVIENA